MSKKRQNFHKPIGFCLIRKLRTWGTTSLKVAIKPFHRRFYMLKNVLKIKSGRSMPCKSKGKKTTRKNAVQQRKQPKRRQLRKRSSQTDLS